ncbi:hypothetical protein [Pseudoramibacter sp.]|jgi:hypothetical protein|uniref:hypothetical protein n=1 Tax=Pseudoramibacter sp. TaxID=2034862 RepID=UPI0025FE12A1|nr:hypothetical protein [Pseudoramibacter sp.]MCH4072343.1 hypothetical protein [Pseudoramibacter sp.]MCH4106114.1 hypothetical protein [Pseudoramibacter sp.]
MLTLLCLIFVAVLLFKGTIFLFRIAGHILGGLFGILVWLFVAAVVVKVLGFLLFLPIAAVGGIAALATGAGRY